MKKEDIRHFLIYLVVGGLATLVEWAAFWVVNSVLHVHYAPATSIAFVLSIFANWAFGRLLLFKGGSDKGLWRELLEVYAAGAIGLLINLLIMWIAVDLLGINEMISKIGATGIAFFWNYLIRRLFIYKKK